MAGDDELCYITVTEAIARFKAKSLSPVELMKAIIARSDSVNPKVNALTATFYDRALEQARSAEATYLESNFPHRPLEGVPIAIKDYHPIKDEITTYGSAIFASHRSVKSAPTVDRLLNAGAIMHQGCSTLLDGLH